MKRWLIPFLFVAFALGQAPSKGKAAPAPAPSPVVTDELTAYLLPDDLKLKNRDLQLEWAERETANQTMLLTIEKNKERQAEITQAILKICAERELPIRKFWADHLSHVAVYERDH